MKGLAHGAMALGLFTLACKGADADLPPAYRKIPVPEDHLSSATALEHGRVLFLQHCALCHGVAGDGRVITPLAEAELPALVTALRAAGVEAVAVARGVQSAGGGGIRCAAFRPGVRRDRCRRNHE